MGKIIDIGKYSRSGDGRRLLNEGYPKGMGFKYPASRQNNVVKMKTGPMDSKTGLMSVCKNCKFYKRDFALGHEYGRCRHPDNRYTYQSIFWSYCAGRNFIQRPLSIWQKLRKGIFNGAKNNKTV
jgi:hypothetical protein